VVYLFYLWYENIFEYMKYYTILSLIVILLSACGGQQTGEPDASSRFELVPSAKSGISFVNKVENTEAFNIFSYRNFYNGGGVALGDINNDGLIDVYFTNNMGKNKLYLNKGEFQFEDISKQAGVEGEKGWSTGVVMVDINSDGLLDIYVCNAGYVKGDDQENELFINQGLKDGMPAFEESAEQYQLNQNGYTTHAAFFDYDLDGDLDAYILNNSFMPVNTLNYSNKRELYAEDWPVRDFLKGGGDKLLRNDDGVFVDATRDAGIYGSLIGFGLGVVVGDINADNWPDLYISNDFFERDYLYINQQDGTFKEDITNAMQHISLFSMGADLADINNDGYPEVFATDMLPAEDERLKLTTVFENYNIYLMKQQRGFYHQYMQNTLQLNNQDGTFSEIGQYSGVAASDWSWGALMFDADNDGYRDIYVCNGIQNDLTNQDFINFFANDVVQKMALTGKKEEMQAIIDKMPSTPIPNKMFHNKGDLTFEELGADWGLAKPSFSNGAAYGDLDNDGDLDLVVNNANAEAFVYRNHTAEEDTQHYLQLYLEGKQPNIRAIGAKVFVFQGDNHYYAQMMPARGFQSSVDYRLHFGLGPHQAIDSVKIIWPDLQQSVLTQLPVDTLLTIQQQAVENEAVTANGLNAAVAPPAFFEQTNHSFPAHQEDLFIDFFQEGLSIRMLSREGPGAAVGDIDNNGTDDVFIGAASGFPAKMYLQTDGQFQSTNVATFERDSYHEDTVTALFDADGDGDLDIYAGSGGNLPRPDTKYLLDRLYINDGQGNFERDVRRLPRKFTNTAVVIPWDYDSDGDLDIFVGSRNVLNTYGMDPEHALYENDGTGHFKDVIDGAGKALKSAGMITDARLADIFGNGKPQLVIVGEWMGIHLFQAGNGTIEEVSTNLTAYKGWWSGLATTDIDNDGDLDMILGNRGENFYFTGSKESPARIWINDFDRNGTTEKIITRSIDGKDLPIPMKGELTEQIVSLKKQNLKHEEYARQTIQDLFEASVLEKAVVKEANYFKSAIAINEGDGQFTMTALPASLQFSCICDIYCTDINNDGAEDIILGGNDHNFMPQFASLDASFGHVLLNDGEGQLSVSRPADSGFFVRGDVKQILPMTIAGQPHVLVLINNGMPSLFRLKQTQKLIQ
jgi:hypothetical protein